MKKTLSVLLTLCATFALIGLFSSSFVKAADKVVLERIDLTLDEEKFNYFFNVAYTEGELDDVLIETLDVDDKSKYYLSEGNTFIMYCYDEGVKNTYDGYYGTGDGSEKIKADTTYCIKVLLFTESGYGFGENLQVYLNGELQDPLHKMGEDSSYYYRYGDYGIEFKFNIGYCSTEKIVTGFEVSEVEKQVVIGESETFTATVEGTVDDKTVNWSITGNTSAATVVSNGKVTIGADETAKELTLRAASNANPKFYQDIKLYVLSEKPYIESVTINDINTNRVAGSIVYVSAVVTGTQINKDVIWSVEGANSMYTGIDEYGYLTIAIDETSTEVTVVATSEADPTKKDSLTFTVTPATPLNLVNINLDQNFINDLLKCTSTEGQAQTAIRENISTSSELKINTSNTWLQYEGSPGNFYGVGHGGNQMDINTQYAVSVRINSNAGYYVSPENLKFELNGKELTPFEYYFNEDSTLQTDLYVVFLLQASGELSITIQDVEGGTASASRPSAIAGSEIKLTHEADENHIFKEWVVVSGGVEISEDKFILGEEPVVIKPVFEPAYSISVSHNGYGQVLSIDKAPEGKEIILDIYPNAGYMVKEIRVLSGGVTLNNNVFTMGTADVTLEVIFSKIVYLTITGNEDVTKGHVSCSVDRGVEGTEVTLVPTAASGYQFIKWVVVSGGITIEDNKFTFGSYDVVIYAVFEQFKGVSITSDQYGVASADVVDALEGTKVTLTATPNQGCKFIKWIVLSGNVEITDNQFVMGSEPVSIKAEFKPIVNLTLTNDGNGTATANISEGVDGDLIDLYATPNAGYVFKEWIIVEGDASLENNSLTLGLKNVTVKAVFEKLYTVTVNTDGNGTAEADVKEAISGTLVNLTSKADDGYYLIEYQVIEGGITVDGDKFIILSADVVIKAVFGLEHVCKPIIVEKVEATCNEPGKQAYYKCTCGAYYEDDKATIIINDLKTWGIIPIKEHVSSDWLKDESGHWKACTNNNCNHIIVEKTAHTPNIPSATEEQAKVCTECGYVMEEKLEHVHKYVGEYKSDKDNHWKECACGDKEELAHTPNIPNATEEQAKVCTECGYVMEEKLEHVHKYVGEYKYDKDNHWKECACGDKEQSAHTPNIPNATEEQAKVCTECGYVMEEKLEHVHKYVGEYKSDKDNHWKECACGDKEASAHTPNIPSATVEQAKVCTECGYVMEEKLTHVHEYVGEYKSDKDYHWKECACGDKEQSAHTPNIPSATEDQDKVCTECGYVIEEKHAHVHEYQDAYKSDKDNHWKECACGEISYKAKHVDINGDSKCDVCLASMASGSNGSSCGSSSAQLAVALLSSLSLLTCVIIKKRD